MTQCKLSEDDLVLSLVLSEFLESSSENYGNFWKGEYEEGAFTICLNDFEGNCHHKGGFLH